MATVIHKAVRAACSQELIEQWMQAGVTIASDVSRGIHVCDPGIRPLNPSAKLCGRALTVRCDPGDLGAVVHAIDRAEPGDVLVVDAGGRGDYAAMGDLFAGAARRAGMVGAVVDGAVRDVGTLREWHDFAVWARSHSPRAMPFKAGGEVNGVISCGARIVSPGDMIIADANGVAVMPIEAARQLVVPALSRLAFEKECAAKIANGALLVQMFDLPAATPSD